jgi:hypothetical protein
MQPIVRESSELRRPGGDREQTRFIPRESVGGPDRFSRELR